MLTVALVLLRISLHETVQILIGGRIVIEGGLTAGSKEVTGCNLPRRQVDAAAVRHLIERTQGAIGMTLCKIDSRKQRLRLLEHSGQVCGCKEMRCALAIPSGTDQLSK